MRDRHNYHRGIRLDASAVEIDVAHRPNHKTAVDPFLAQERKQLLMRVRQKIDLDVGKGALVFPENLRHRAGESGIHVADCKPAVTAVAAALGAMYCLVKL